MSIEGGARVGYVNPDDKTFAYLRGRPHSPSEDRWDDMVNTWRSFASDVGCEYDDFIEINASEIAPTVTWGINPAQAVTIDEDIPSPNECESSERASIVEALEYMKLDSGNPIKGTPIDVAFIGSCTNGRLSDLEEVASKIKGHQVKNGVKAIVVPGSQVVK